jgi:WD40 repeat protein
VRFDGGRLSLAVGAGQDGALLVAVAEDAGGIRIWQPRQRDGVIQNLQGLASQPGKFAEAEHIVTLAIGRTPDGRVVIASGSYRGLVQFWDLEGHMMALRQYDRTLPVGAMTFDRAGSQLIVGSWDESVRFAGINPVIGMNRIHDGVRWSRPTYRGLHRPVHALAIDPKERFVAVGGSDATVQLLDHRTAGYQIGHPLVAQPEQSLNSVSLHPAGISVAAGGQSGDLLIWQIENGALLAKPAHEGELTSLTHSPDGSTLVTGGRDGAVRVWDAVGNPLKNFPNSHAGGVHQVEFSRNGKRFATVGEDGYLLIWDASRNAVERKVGMTPKAPVKAVSLTRDGALVATLSGQTVTVWKPDGSRHRQFEAPAANDVALSIDGETLFVGGADGYLYRLDLDGKQKDTPIRVHLKPITHLHVGAQSLFASSEDGNVALFDNRTGRQWKIEFEGPGVATTAVSATTDGSMAAGAGHSGEVQLWRSSAEAWLDVGCDRLKNHTVFTHPEQREGWELADALRARHACEVRPWRSRSASGQRGGAAKSY